jgi:haloalkane dehalogenase
MCNEASAGSDGTPVATSPYTMREHVHGARYCEVLLVTGRLNKIEATVYNTLGLNECPAEQWQSLDSDAIKDQHHARAAILNGPRYFLMDRIGIVNPRAEIVDFGGLQMRRLATVPLRITDVLGGFNREPFSEQAVSRTTVYVYDQGREVYELIAPDGASYVMQSYSQAVAPTLSEADLPTLGERLHLPDGWRYRARTLDAEWTLHVDGEARVIRDDLENTYQRVGQDPA